LGVEDMLHGAKKSFTLPRGADKERVRQGQGYTAGICRKKKERDTRLWERLRQQLDDKNYPIQRKVEEAKRNGAIVTAESDPRHVLQELPYLANDNYLMVDEIHEKVWQPIKDAGMSDDDFGVYLMLRRIITERAEIANPYGFDPRPRGNSWIS